MTEDLKSNNPATQSHEDRQHALDRKRYTVEKTTLFFLFLYVTIAAFQWCANKKAADAAKSAADTADATLKSSQKQFRDEHRPYIWLEPGVALPDHPITNTPLPELVKKRVMLGFNVGAKNGGPSPAVDIVITRAVMIFDTSEKAKRQAEAYVPEYLPTDALAPNTGFYLGSPQPIETNNQLLKDIRDDRKRIYVLARVQYRDISTPRNETPYETALCVRINAGGLPFQICDPDMKQSYVK